MVRRNRRQRRKNYKEAVYIVIGGILIAAVIGVVGTLLWMKPEKIEIDPLTLCPLKEGPTAYTSIVIDRTDSFGSISKADLEVQLRDTLDSTRKNEQISLFVVEPVEKAPLRSLITVCNPGNPNEADPWTQNPDLVDRNWRMKFQTPLETLLNSLLTEKEAPVSPIMESVQSVSVTILGGKQKSSLPRRIILVSDLMQNSQAWSLYTQKPDFLKFSRSRASKGLNPDLRDVSVELLFLQRETRKRVNEKELLRFWVEWIESFGGRVTRILKLSGMNR